MIQLRARTSQNRTWLCVLVPVSAILRVASVAIRPQRPAEADGPVALASKDLADSTAIVIGAMIIAPLMTPILGVVLGVVLTDRANLGRCLLLLAAGAAAVVAVSWLLGHVVPYPVTAATNSQVAGRVTPRIVDLVAALATGAVGAVALGPAGYLRHPARRGHRHLAGAAAGHRQP